MGKSKRIITEYRHYDLQPDFPILVLHGERWHISDRKSERLHFHNCLEIGVCHSHSGYMDFGDETVPYKAGDFTLIARNYPHTTYSTPGAKSLWSYIFVYPEIFFNNQPFTTSNEHFITQLNYHISNKEESPRLYNYICAVIDEMTQQRPGYMSIVNGLITAIFVEILRLSKKNAEDGTASQTSGKEKGSSLLTIHPALNYIHDNYMQQFPVSKLADMCHLSVTHFRRTFNTIMGTSPLEFINSTRIDHACLLLSSTGSSILDISEQVGFHSISSFNRSFMKITGTSPREYRRKYDTGKSVARKKSVLEYSGWM